ncbi:MAG: hypothetical protein BWY72_01950 [Bacteroidetes bacterium ADurb.Bin416]|nr:MAG: hypothetical protein BWY72_01950 [Bacteroidetes bacterium ADurb.Bin416]
MFKTPTWLVSGCLSRRSEKMSVQRFCWSVTEPLPSVMELPRIATAYASSGALTSRAFITYQCSVRTAVEKSEEGVEKPLNK